MVTQKHKGLSGLLSLIVLLLLFDNNYFGKIPVIAVIGSKVVELSGGSKPSSSVHATEFIKDQNGNKYKVPLSLFDYYHIGDTFFIIRSSIFHKAIRIESKKNDTYIKKNIGVLNSDGFSIIISIIPLLLCIVTVFFHRLLKSDEQQMAVLFFSILLTIVIVAFYFIFST
jgi:hypothetical protein